MTYKEFVDNQVKFLKENPGLAELDVITSQDDEGNGFTRVVFEPQAGNFYDDCEFDGDKQPFNAVCVN